MSRCFNCKKSAAQIINLSVEMNGGTQNVGFNYCSEECKQKIEQFVSYNNTHTRDFIIIGITAFVLLLFMSILAIFFKGLYAQVLPWMLIAVGIPFLIRPLGTWVTYRLFGIRYTNLLIQIFALVFIIEGLAVLIYK